MSTLPALFLATLVLLAVPGPTNALLATAGAVAGVHRSLRLLGAVLFGYGVSITALVLAVGPAVQARPTLVAALQLASAAYLAVMAWKLWSASSPVSNRAIGIDCRDVALATMTNPKVLVLAFAILPENNRAGEGLLLSAACVGAVVVITGLMWLTIGAVLGEASSGRVQRRSIGQAGSVVLGLFAVGLSLSALGLR